MSEEEIIKILNSYTTDLFHSYKEDVILKAIRNLLDLYNKEKENNKELFEVIDKLQEENQQFKIVSQENYLNAFISANFISKDKIKETIERKISCCRAEELEDNYIDDKHSQYWKMYRELLEKLEQELLEE